MLICVSRYRSAGKGIFAEPGEVLSGLTAEQEAELLADSPGSFRVYRPTSGRKHRAMQAPGRDEMARREAAVRKDSQGGGDGVMTRADHAALMRGTS